MNRLPVEFVDAGAADRQPRPSLVAGQAQRLLEGQVNDGTSVADPDQGLFERPDPERKIGADP